MTQEYGQKELTNYQYMLGETVGIVNVKSSDRVNFNKNFNVFISTLRKGLIDQNQYKQMKKAQSMEQSTSWKITKPLRMISSLVKRILK